MLEPNPVKTGSRAGSIQPRSSWQEGIHRKPGARDRPNRVVVCRLLEQPVGRGGRRGVIGSDLSSARSRSLELIRSRAATRIVYSLSR